MRGAALIAGQLAGIALMGFVQAVFYLAVGLAAGVRLESGVPGAFVLLALATLIAIAFGALGAFFALRTGSGEAVQGLFPLLFVLLFLSSMNLPRNLIEIDWFRIVATINPVSYLIEGVRSLIISGWDTQALLLGFGIAATMMGVSARPPPRAGAARPAGAAARFSSVMVFHSPQPGQRPCHLGLSWPHEEQAKIVAERAIRRG